MTNMSPSSPSNAGVRIDPQLIYTVPLIAGLWLNRWHPLPLLPAPFATPVGVTLVVLGLAFVLPAAWRFARAGTSPQPWRPSTALVTEGPYRISRNPIYLGYTLLYLGVMFWVDTVWPLFVLPLVLWMMYRTVIAREEVYLESRFGDAYRAYRRRVRRWL
jgi:protein-S-isoprenylcysteine O-methyltransferase Ste14